ncbi:MAG: RNA polymerase sigma factor [Alphaproteobacteria bacterium]
MSAAENRLIASVIADNDGKAFAGLVKIHQSRIRGYLLRLTRGDQFLSDDLAQEVFMTAFRKIKSFQGTGSFSGWLHRIAYSRFLMDIRKKASDQKREAAWDQIQQKTFTPSDLNLDVEKALSALKTEERSALTLCFSHGYTHEEACIIMDLPLGTLKSHVARGKIKLAKSLAHLKRDFS